MGSAYSEASGPNTLDASPCGMYASSRSAVRAMKASNSGNPNLLNSLPPNFSSPEYECNEITARNCPSLLHFARSKGTIPTG
jgi:hypothetical protein